MKRFYGFFIFLLTAGFTGGLFTGCGSKSSPTSPSVSVLNYTGAAITVVNGGNVYNPRGLAYDGTSGNLWIMNFNNPGLLNEYTDGGSAVTSTSIYTGTSKYNQAWGLNAGPDGYLYVCDEGNNQVVVLNSSGGYVTAITGLTSPECSLVNAAGTTLYVVENTSPRVTLLTYSIASHVYTARVNNFPNGCSCALDPSGIPFMAMDASGNIYAVDGAGDEVLKYDSTGANGVTFIPASSSVSPYGIAIDGSGNVFVGEYTTPNYVEVYNSTGSAEVSIGSSAFSYISGLALDSSANLFVANNGNSQLLEIKK